MSDNVFEEVREDFDDELEDFDDEIDDENADHDNSGGNLSAPVFNAVEEPFTEVKPQEQHDKQNVRDEDKKLAESVFAPIDDKELDQKIMERNKVWREATLSGEDDDGVECALAHGLPDWDLMPPEMLVRRRSVR